MSKQNVGSLGRSIQDGWIFFESMAGGVVQSGEIQRVAIATMSNFTINAGGSQIISGGSAISTIVNGVQDAQSAYIQKSIISSGGLLIVDQNTLAQGCEVKAGGSIIAKNYLAYTNIGPTIVSSGGHIAFTSMYGNNVGSLELRSGATMRVNSGNVSLGDAYMAAGARIIVASGGIAMNGSISGTQAVSSGGTARYAGIQSGGTQLVSSGGRAENCNIQSGATQYVHKGGAAVNNSVYGRQIIHTGGFASGNNLQLTGAEQIVSSGATAAKDRFSWGAKQNVLKGGSAVSCTFEGGLSVQTVSSGGVAIKTFLQRGSQIVRKGGVASDCIVSDGGRQIISSGGKALNTSINRFGSQIIHKGGQASGTDAKRFGKLAISGGVATNATAGNDGQIIVYLGSVKGANISRGGLLTAYGSDYLEGKSKARAAITSGTKVYYLGVETLSGGQATKSILYADAAQNVLNGGYALSAAIKGKASQIVGYGGSARAATVSSGGLQTVSLGGLTSATKILAGGHAVINYGGIARTVTVAKNGRLSIGPAAAVSAFTLQSGAKMELEAGCAMGGKNTATGAKVSATVKGSVASLEDGSTLTLVKNNVFTKVDLNAEGATLAMTGNNNTLYKLTTDAAANVNFDVRNVAVKETAAMLKLTRSGAHTGKTIITTKKGQALGVYELAKNMAMTSADFTIRQGATLVGKVKMGKSLSKNGVKYALATKNGQVSLTISAVKGRIAQGGARAAAITGTANSDIFYAAYGNDVIKCVNGRDVVIYDKNNWGKDTIAATNGTVNILMAGLKASDITKTMKGKDMVITRKDDARQQVTVRNWSAATHKIVFGGTLPTLNKYLASAQTNAKQKNLAFSEVWKKAGLLA